VGGGGEDDDNDEDDDDNNNGVTGGRKRARFDPSHDTVLVMPAHQKLTNGDSHPMGEKLLTLTGGQRQKERQERVIVIVGEKGGVRRIAHERVREQGRSRPPVLEPQ